MRIFKIIAVIIALLVLLAVMVGRFLGFNNLGDDE
jgi:hypothetical protein